MAIYNGGLNIIAQDISGKEDKSNKVSSWSSTTTDAHYPSEKLVKDALDTKVNTANVLTLEEIQATTDLTGKVASASAVKSLKELKVSGYSGYLESKQSITVYRKTYPLPVAAYLFVNFGDASNEFALYYISPSPNAHLILGTKNENIQISVTYDNISVTNNLLWAMSVHIIGEITGVA